MVLDHRLQPACRQAYFLTSDFIEGFFYGVNGTSIIAVYDLIND